MGVMTFQNFRDELAFLLGNRNDADATDPTRVDRWINQAYTFMCHPSVHNFREMQEIYEITLATGVNEYSVSKATIGYDIVAVQYLSFVQATSFTNTARKRRLHPRDIRWFEERTLSTGQPTLYTFWKENLYISAIPRATENGQLLRMGLFREPAVLSADADTTTISSYYDRPLLKFAQSFAEVDLGDRNLSILTAQEAQALLNNAGEERELEAADTDWVSEFIVRPVMGHGSAGGTRL